jgi:uncharacterized SAM-binding protein YcdF (DUF218 family)
MITQLAYGLLQPHTLLLIVSVVALILFWRRRGEPGRRGFLAFVIPLSALFLLCLPVVSYLSLGSLEWHYPPLAERPKDIEAIVVVSGYAQPKDNVLLEPELGADTLLRCMKAADLYHRGGRCKVLVSGGPVRLDETGLTLASLMQAFLHRLGVKEGDVIVEDRSTTTYENALYSSEILKKVGIHKVVLVTDATHLARALGCFRKQGIEAVPCGCRYRATSFLITVENLLPDPSAARGFQVAWHEWLGLAWYRLKGRI